MEKGKPVIDFIVGARPNFIKASSIFRAIKSAHKLNFQYRLLHTGQHYDYQLSGTFFDQLGLPTPDYNLNVGSGTHNYQTASIMLAYEQTLRTEMPDMTVVFGDVNSTLACAITAAKMGVRVAHVEAGIRSYDWSMPEEVNRVATDSISDLLFTTTKNASDILHSLGHKNECIYFVGNTMVDTLLAFSSSFYSPAFLESTDFVLVTLHRQANVDNPQKINNLITQCKKLSSRSEIIFPVHPRTFKVIKAHKINTDGITLCEPLPYYEFGYLVKNAKLIITDSGGITEEATVWGTPCLTARENTERPETVELGSNILIGDRYHLIPEYFELAFSQKWKSSRIPDLWDGRAGDRIIEILNNAMEYV